jgi:hypothetical protein
MEGRERLFDARQSAPKRCGDGNAPRHVLRGEQFRCTKQRTLTK